MPSKTRTIELDEAIATALKDQAEARGLTVPCLVAEYLQEDRHAIDLEAAHIAELDRRWACVQAGEPTVEHPKVVRWLESWGTSTFKPWRGQ